MVKADIIVTLQKKYRETYTWEHAYKRGELSIQELQEKLLDTSDDMSIKHHAPWAYDLISVAIYQQRKHFSPDFTPQQLSNFFDDLQDLTVLDSLIDSISKIIQ